MGSNERTQWTTTNLALTFLDNSFCTAPVHCGACRKRWRPVDLCFCG